MQTTTLSYLGATAFLSILSACSGTTGEADREGPVEPGGVEPGADGQENPGDQNADPDPGNDLPDAAQPASMTITTDSYQDLNPNSTLGYTVTVLDEAGNEMTAPPVKVWTEPDSTTVGDTEVTFVEEGVYTLHAKLSDDTLFANAGPFVVDGSGPRISIESPHRGLFTTEPRVEVSGTVMDTVGTVDRVELNGAPVAVNAEGQFTHVVELSVGVNTIATDAWDTEGNKSSAVQAALYGEAFAPTDSAISDSLVARLNEPSIGVLASAAESAIDVQAIERQVEGLTIWSDCITIIPGTFFSDPVRACARLRTTDFQAGRLSIQLDPQNGSIAFVATLYDVRVVTALTGDLPSMDPYIEADAAVVTGSLHVPVENGAFKVSLTGTSVSLNGFDMGFDSLPGWLNDVVTIGDLLNGVVRPITENAIRDEIAKAVPPAIESFLNQLEIATPIDLAGATIDLLAKPTATLIDDSGLSLVLNSTVSAQTADPEITGPGPLLTQSRVPAFHATPGFFLSISDEFLNQTLYALWTSGLIHTHFDLDAMGVDLSLLNLLLPGNNGFDVELTPLLPPVFRPEALGASQGDVQLGDLLLDLHANYPDREREHVAQVAVSAFAGVAVSVTPEETLAIDPKGELTLASQGLFSAVPNVNEEALAGLVETLLPSLLPDLLSSVEAFPIPSFLGYTVGSPSVSLSDNPADYVNIGGDLVAE